MTSPAASEKYFDEVIEEMGNHNIINRSYANIITSPSDDAALTPEHLAFLKSVDLISGSTLTNVVHVLGDWKPPPDFNINIVGSMLSTHGAAKFDDLPHGLRPLKTLPPGSCINFLLHSQAGGTYKVIRQFCFQSPIRVNKIGDYIEGPCFCIPFRQNTHGARKAFLHIFRRIPGWHAAFNILEEKQSLSSVGGASGGRAPAWNPSDDELDAGIDFINEKAPSANNMNQQLRWMLKEMRRKGSPIFGWPNNVVKEAIHNKSKNTSQSDGETFLPLCTLDLQPVFTEHILPLIARQLQTHGLIMVGAPGVGKTQLAKIMSMGYGRWLVSRDHEGGVPGWRRGGRMDVFREAPGVPYEAILLDDPRPQLPEIDIETVKAFLDAGENTLCDARFSHAKFARNCLRIIMSNHWDDKAEPTAGFSVTEQDFLKMINPALGGTTTAHRDAVMKRSVILVAGHHAVYVRMPSEHLGQEILVFRQNLVHEDFLLDDHKAALNAYRCGRQVKYPGYEEALVKELELWSRFMAEPAEAERLLMLEKSKREWEVTPEEARAAQAAAAVDSSSASSSSSSSSAPRVKRARVNLDDSQSAGLLDEDGY
jgi:hypothetical protein